MSAKPGIDVNYRGPYVELFFWTFAILLLAIAWLHRYRRLELTQAELDKTRKALEQAKSKPKPKPKRKGKA